MGSKRSLICKDKFGSTYLKEGTWMCWDLDYWVLLVSGERFHRVVIYDYGDHGDLWWCSWEYWWLGKEEHHELIGYCKGPIYDSIPRYSQDDQVEQEERAFKGWHLQKPSNKSII